MPSAQPAFADFRIVERFNPETKVRTVGLQILSSDEVAAFFFLCRTLNQSPQVTFEQNHVLAKARYPFELSYRIDGGQWKKSEFWTQPDGKGGLLAPPQRPLDKSTKFDWSDKEKLDALYERELENYRQANNRFVADFLSGAEAEVQVWDSVGKAYTYSFELVGSATHIDSLSDCYTPVS